jgi:PAS domain S-box-containing protein
MPGSAGILLVEDEAIIAADLEERLTRMGYRVVGIGTTGEEAIGMADARRPDLIVMDVVMPGKMDGIAAATEIRRRFGIPAVFLTAYADLELIERAKASTPLGYILKPFREHQLYSTVEIALYNGRMERRMQESEARYRAVVEDQSDLVCRFSRTGILTFCNRAFRQFFSEHPVDAPNISFASLFPEADAAALRNAVQAMTPPSPYGSLQVRAESLSGEDRHLHWVIAAIPDLRGQISEYQAVGRDITERVLAEEEVRRLNRELEWRVEERTRDLEAKTRRLEEANVALEVLLERREADRRELERNILHNVRELIEPTLQHLRLAASDATRAAYLDVLETNLKEILSPFSRRLTDGFAGLTAQEIQVANLVRQGKTAKETAEIMGLSFRTIDTYRASIRKKLGITQRRVSLQGHLKSLG